MKILFLASECAPFAKVGGLADVVGALPKALKNLGIDVRICLPKYQVLDLEKHKFSLLAKDIVVKDEKVNIYQGFLPESQVIVYLLESEKYLSQNGIYFKEIPRFLFFPRAVLEIFPPLNWFPDVIHCHDWHAALVPLLLKLKTKNPKFKTLLTIHNLAQQGKWQAKKIFAFLNLKGKEIESLKLRDKEGDFNILQQGILNTDLINTVSPAYAKEVLTAEYGQGLEGWLLKRKNEFSGILNGIDEKKFNPASDSNLKTNYSWQNLERKIENKVHLQEELSLNKNQQTPLSGFVGRLDSQKGIDLIMAIIPELIKNNCQLAILGAGNPDYEKKLRQLSEKYSQNVSVQIKFDPVLAQKIYAGADIFLLPSRFEPCGLVQMIAMRYGTLPVARKIGGLADTVEEGKTGFLFEEYTAEDFWRAVEKALAIYPDKKKWQKLMVAAMKKDFSWQKSASAYRQLYQQLVQ